MVRLQMIKGVCPVLLLLLLLAACGESHEEMLQQLEELERMNRADSVMQNDSLAQQLADYFDRHGNANERMRAHYILGRTYADMGEAPAALNAYLDAASCADTTAADCDYHQLSRIYGQMSIVFYRQNLMVDYLNASDRSADYAWRDHDTMHALNVEAYKVAAYNRLNQYDKAIATFDHVYDQLKQTYGVATAAKFCLLPIKSLIEKGDYDKAGKYLSLLEQNSGFFDSVGNIEKGREGYYYYKGRYLLAVGQLDSAMYFFRKELQTGLDVTNQSMASRGLSLVFSENGPQDSAIKYALYSYEMNDSVYAQMATTEVEQAKASYDYTRNQLLAEKKTSEAQRTKIVLLLVVGIAVVLFLALMLAHVLYRRKKQVQMLQYRHDLENLERAQTDLMELYSSESLQSEQQEREIALLKKDIESYQSCIAEYQQKLLARDAAELEERLFNAPIVKRLKDLATANPYQSASSKDMKQLRQLVNEEIPDFYGILNTPAYIPRPAEYDISLLIRCHFTPSEISKLTGTTYDYVAKVRKRLLTKIFGIDGNPKDFDSKVMSII